MQMQMGGSKSGCSCSEELCDDLSSLQFKITVASQRAPPSPFNLNDIAESMIDKFRGLSWDNKVDLDLEDKMEELLDLLIERQSQLSLVAIIDTMGFDRTAFIGEAYNSSYVKNYFDCCAWVYYQLSLDMMLDAIMKSLMPLSALREILDNDFEMKKNTLHNYLKNKRYLIVVQDVWRGDIWDFLKETLPDHQNGSRILTALIHIVGLSSCRLENDENIRLDLVPPKGKLRARYDGWPLVILYYGSKPLESTKQEVEERLDYPLMYSLLTLPSHLKLCWL